MLLTANTRYRLTRDVENPLADKRQRYDIERMTWKAEDVFFCSPIDVAISDEPTRIVLTLEPVKLADGSDARTVRFSSGRVWPRHPGYASLIDALEPMPESLDDILRGAGVDGADVLASLVRRGVVSLIDVRDACMRLAGGNE